MIPSRATAVVVCGRGEDYDYWIGGAVYIDEPLQKAWAIVKASHSAVDSVLKLEADLNARFPSDKKYSFENRGNVVNKVYSKEYTEEYNKLLNGMVERRMREAIKTTASFWYTAWVNAGQPDLKQLINKNFSDEDRREFDELNKAWLKGEASLTAAEDTSGPIDVSSYNGIGIQAIEGANDGDNTLVLGGEDPEYNGCPNVLILNHFFDGAEDPVTDDGAPILTILELVPCTTDYLRQIPGAAVVQYLVYNEFEQRFSTSRPFQCQQFSLISNIDTTQNQRSIFSAGVSGTLTGQSRINPIGSGVLAVAHEIHLSSGLADFNVHFQGDRADPDFIILP
jgi:hypothetical protein